MTSSTQTSAADKPARALVDYPADARSQRLALLVALASVGLFVALVPFAKTPLPAAHWFIPLNQSALIINDLVTATLLIGQLRLTRTPALLVLACAYVFSALMAALHLLSFPGVFGATGILGGGAQTTAYLFIFWHAGFPALVLVYALLKALPTNSFPPWATHAPTGLLTLLVTVTTLALLAVHSDRLPPVLAGIRYASGFNVFQYGQWVVTGLALVVLWRRRSRAVLDIWLLVVLLACFLEIALVSIFNGGRYDLGFYAGRAYALLASSFIMLVLLNEQAKLYQDLATANEAARSADELRKSREVLKLAMQSGRMGAWSRDVIHNSAWWSPELEHVAGLAPGSLAPTAEALVERAHPEDRTAVSAALRGELPPGKELTFEFRLRHADGAWTWVEGHARAVQDAQGRTASLYGILADISARKQAQASAAQLEARFQALADGMPQLAWMARPDGWIYWYNTRWYQFTGTTPAEMEGWGWQRIHDPDTLPAVLETWRHSIDSGEPFEMVFPLRGADGRFRHFLTRVSPLKDGEGRVQHWFGTNTDITAQRDAQEALRHADRRKDEFLATLAHELRNPLAPIRMSIELLGRSATWTAADARARQIIDRQSRHLSRLVDDLLEVSRITEGKMRLQKSPVSLAACLSDAAQAVQGLMSAAGHHFTMDLASDRLTINADATRITQAFVNLLTNAAKFTPPGGRISVAVLASDGHAQISVKDSGVGIASADLPNIFEMFAQVTPSLQRSQGGLGIGLSLVRGIIELHGGSVTAHSPGAGQGSEFQVTLPLHLAPVSPWVRPPAESPQVRSRRILIVDDNRDAAESLATILQLSGHEVRTAHDGVAALRLAFEFEPHVVLLDLGMPGMSGLDVARQLRKQSATSSMRLIALTGWGQASDRQLTAEAGFDDHLTKPVDWAELEALLGGTAPPESSLPALHDGGRSRELN